MLTTPIAETLEEPQPRGPADHRDDRAGAGRGGPVPGGAGPGACARGRGRLDPGAPAGAVLELPTYAFQRQRYWLRPAVPRRAQEQRDGSPSVEPVLDDWRYRVSWSPLAAPGTARLSGTWLLVGGEPTGASAAQTEPQAGALTEAVARALTGHGARVTVLTLAADGRQRAALAELIRRSAQRARWPECCPCWRWTRPRWRTCPRCRAAWPGRWPWCRRSATPGPRRRCGWPPPARSAPARGSR
ncbi:hypothetical protein GXW82_03400 [Streptacidiphilus sp. 4-A2]|nr:hypothetical protein [Streptacidiphilus sp. 4-A2]